MARRVFAPSLSKRDQALKSNRDDAHYAKLFGKEPVNQVPIPGARKVTARTPETEAILEAGVMRDVAKLLALHPMVLMAWRVNGGAAPAADGVFRIWYYKFVCTPEKMTIPDFIGLLANGRMFALECKRRDWHYTGTEREQAQKNFIDRIIASGGRGGFVTSAKQAQAILK